MDKFDNMPQKQKPREEAMTGNQIFEDASKNDPFRNVPHGRLSTRTLAGAEDRKNMPPKSNEHQFRA